MKSVTEFWNFTLEKGLKAKAELAAAGKTPEEIQTALGETMKYEGDKLAQFVAALEVASQNTEGLSRVLVVSLAEGETAPPKSVKIGETHYVPEFKSAPKPVQNVKSMGKSGGGGPRKDRGPKESPWGLSPEQKAAKKGAGAKGAAPKKTDA
jgi:hypothetical protein